MCLAEVTKSPLLMRGIVMEEVTQHEITCYIRLCAWQVVVMISDVLIIQKGRTRIDAS